MFKAWAACGHFVELCIRRASGNTIAFSPNTKLGRPVILSSCNWLIELIEERVSESIFKRNNVFKLPGIKLAH